MLCSTTRNLSRLILAAAFACAGRAEDKIKLTSASIDPLSRKVVVGISASQDDFTAALKSLANRDSWGVSVKGQTIDLLAASVDSVAATVTLRFAIGQVVESSAAEIPEKEAEVEYIPQRLRFPIKTGAPKPPPPPHWHNFLEGCYSFAFTDDKDKADISLTGAFQAGVNATPQYNWSAKAKCTMLGEARKPSGELDLSFTGEASQEGNADPDSLKAGVKWSRRVASKKHASGWFIDLDAVSYEFERKSKKEAYLKDGKPALRPYLEKNSNLIWGGLVRYHPDWRPVSLTLGLLGFEGGEAMSRSVKANSQSGGPWPVARLHFSGDAYKYFYRGSRTVFTIHAHHEVRLPFEPEPYVRSTENGGNMYLTDKPRHYSLGELGIPVTDGVAISIQYKRGSLPPSYEFVNHQITLGFSLTLAKK